MSTDLSLVLAQENFSRDEQCISVLILSCFFVEIFMADYITLTRLQISYTQKVIDVSTGSVM